MNIFKRPLKKKIADIKRDIENLISANCDEKFWIDWYGAYDIDPKHLVFWICVLSDEMKLRLASNAELNSELHNLLIVHDYPHQSREFVTISFESQETVDRESGGSWYDHFK